MVVMAPRVVSIVTGHLVADDRAADPADHRANGTSHHRAADGARDSAAHRARLARRGGAASGDNQDHTRQRPGSHHLCLQQNNGWIRN